MAKALAWPAGNAPDLVENVKERRLLGRPENQVCQDKSPQGQRSRYEEESRSQGTEAREAGGDERGDAATDAAAAAGDGSDQEGFAVVRAADGNGGPLGTTGGRGGEDRRAEGPAHRRAHPPSLGHGHDVGRLWRPSRVVAVSARASPRKGPRRRSDAAQHRGASQRRPDDRAG